MHAVGGGSAGPDVRFHSGESIRTALGRPCPHWHVLAGEQDARAAPQPTSYRRRLRAITMRWIWLVPS
jgi:hypothetical protein